MQTHKCAFLEKGDRCRADEYCQYKLILARAPWGSIFCGKDQIIGATFVNTITPQRILDYVTLINKDLDQLSEGNYSGKDAAKWLKFYVDQIEFQAKYMIEDAFVEAVKNGDRSTLERLFNFNPEYRLKAAIALTKLLFENTKTGE